MKVIKTGNWVQLSFIINIAHNINFGSYSSIISWIIFSTSTFPKKFSPEFVFLTGKFPVAPFSRIRFSNKHHYWPLNLSKSRWSPSATWLTPPFVCTKGGVSWWYRRSLCPLAELSHIRPTVDTLAGEFLQRMTESTIQPVQGRTSAKSAKHEM